METELLAAQGGIVVEVDRGQTFRVNEDGQLLFRVRNLTRHGGSLAMRIRVPRVQLERSSERIDHLVPEGVHELCFGLTATTPGMKRVEDLEVRFRLGGRNHRLVLPDHSVRFRVAPRPEAPGSIVVGDVSFDFRDHVGDVVLQELIAKQDRTHPSQPSQQWQSLALIPRPAHGQIVLREPRRRGLQDLLLIQRAARGQAEQRVFLFARTELCFGLEDRKGDIAVPLVLRRIPCRSESRDPMNHQLNDTISRLHGRLGLCEGRLHVRDESLNGIRLDGRRIEKDAWTPVGGAFRLRLTALQPVMSLAGCIFWPDPERSPLAPGAPREGALGEGTEAGAEHAHPLDAVRLRRIDNAPQHSYVQVFRLATVGSATSTAIHLPREGVAERHAEIAFYRGEWFVRPLQDELLTAVNDQRVGREEYVSLSPGKTLTLGEERLHVRAVTLGTLRGL